MQRLIKHAILFLTLTTTTAIAGDLENGRRAFDAGRYQEALRYWQPLAKQNNPDALFNIGLLYMKGLGVQQNERTALDWFKQAASYGSVDAAYNLGSMYMKGKGAYPSTKTALYWWRQAADVGHADSQFNMGVMYAYGKGVKQDNQQALSFWQKAARQGNQDAIAALVQTYEQGLFGQNKDLLKAQQWARYRY